MNCNGKIKNWLVYKIANKALSETIQKYAKGKLLDIGCGEKQYEVLTKNFVTEHIGLDHEDTLHDKSKTDLLGTAYNIPVENGYFDTVLCTAVLEHLEEPDKAIKEEQIEFLKGAVTLFILCLYSGICMKNREIFIDTLNMA